MSWIELHQSAAFHKKTIGLAKELKIPRPQALGLVSGLWLFALEGAQDGDLAHLTDAEVAAFAGWDGRPARFVEAIAGVRYLDPDRKLHDWYDYAGRLIESRKRDAQRKRDARDGQSTGPSGG